MNITSTQQRNCIAVLPIKNDDNNRSFKDKIHQLFLKAKSRTTTFFTAIYNAGQGIIQNLLTCISGMHRLSIPKPHIRIIPYIPLDKMISSFKKNVRHSIIALVGTLMWLIAFCVIFSMYFTGGYEFVVDGKTVGFSTDKAAYASVLNEVNSELGSTFGQMAKINKGADTIIRIIKKDSLTSNSDFRSNVAALSEFMIRAHVLYIDDKETIGFKTEDELYRAIEMFKSSFAQEGSQVTVLDDIKTEQKYVTAACVYSPQSAQTYFSSENGLKVQTITQVANVEGIDFDKEQITDDSMYADQTETVQSGEFGEKTITSSVTAINGIETSREVLSDVVTKEPIKEIVKIGSKRRPTGIGSGNFLFPTVGTISSRFGSRWGTHHDGIDIANGIGTQIEAADEGVVTFAGVQNGYGNIVIIDHGNGYETRYGHCSELLVNVGDIIEKGQVIALMGSTGDSTGSHLHFEIRKNGSAQNPNNYVSQ